MITDLMLAFLTGIVNGIYNALPSWTINGSYIENLGYQTTAMQIPDISVSTPAQHSPLYLLWVWMAKANEFIPIDHFVLILSLAGTVYGGIFLIKGVKYAVGIIRGAGTQ